MLDPEALAVLADQRRDADRNAEPFPHVVIDDFLPEQVLDTVLTEFPAPAHEAWHRFDDPVQAKLGNRRVETMGPASRQLLHELNSGAMCAFVERLAGLAAHPRRTYAITKSVLRAPAMELAAGDERRFVESEVPVWTSAETRRRVLAILDG